MKRLTEWCNFGRVRWGGASDVRHASVQKRSSACDRAVAPGRTPPLSFVTRGCPPRSCPFWLSVGACVCAVSCGHFPAVCHAAAATPLHLAGRGPTSKFCLNLPDPSLQSSEACMVMRTVQIFLFSPLRSHIPGRLRGHRQPASHTCRGDALCTGGDEPRQAGVAFCAAGLSAGAQQQQHRCHPAQHPWGWRGEGEGNCTQQGRAGGMFVSHGCLLQLRNRLVAGAQPSLERCAHTIPCSSDSVLTCLDCDVVYAR